MQDLFCYIDSIEKQINESQKLFFEKWNDSIRSHLELDGDFCIEKHVDIFGGYWLDKEIYARMNHDLKKFYDKRIKKGDRIFLRGYDYYQVDPLLNTQKKSKNRKQLWNAFRDKWINYQGVDSFDFLINKSVSLENWIGILGLLEYLFTDLTSLRWFIFRNQKLMVNQNADEYFFLVDGIEAFLEIIGEIIACVLKFDFERAYYLICEKYHVIVNSKHLEKLIFAEYEKAEKASIRTIREGDSIALIYASYLMKLKPFCEKNNLKNIKLISNAFGAMNIGIILKYLIAPQSTANHCNILYAQHRVIGDSAYEDVLLNNCCFLDEKDVNIDEKTQAIFVVDDSIFSGKSYFCIKEFLSEKHKVYLLPLTLNCNCIKYCRLGISEKDDMNDIAHRAVQWSMEVNNLVPTFCSFWDFRYSVPENKTLIDNDELRSVLAGNDLLAKHLWTVYCDDIL